MTKHEKEKRKIVLTFMQPIKTVRAVPAWKTTRCSGYTTIRVSPCRYDFCDISSVTCRRGSITRGCEDPMRRLGSGRRKDLLQGVWPGILAPKSSEDSCQCSYFIHYVERSRVSAED